MVKVTGKKIKEFWNFACKTDTFLSDYLYEDDFISDSIFQDDSTDLNDFEELKDDQKYDLSKFGYFISNDDDEKKIKFSTAYCKWSRRLTTEKYTVEIPKDKVDEFKDLLKKLTAGNSWIKIKKG